MTGINEALADVRNLSRKFQAVTKIGDVLEEIGNLEQRQRDANEAVVTAESNLGEATQALTTTRVKLQELEKQRDDLSAELEKKRADCATECDRVMAGARRGAEEILAKAAGNAEIARIVAENEWAEHEAKLAEMEASRDDMKQEVEILLAKLRRLKNDIPEV